MTVWRQAEVRQTRSLAYIRKYPVRALIKGHAMPRTSPDFLRVGFIGANELARAPNGTFWPCAPERASTLSHKADVVEPLYEIRSPQKKPASTKAGSGFLATWWPPCSPGSSPQGRIFLAVPFG